MDGIQKLTSFTSQEDQSMNRAITVRLLSLAISLFFLALLGPADASVITFGSGSNQFDMTFVEIGNPANANDTTGKPNPAGSVAYKYQIGKYEVREEMIDKFNSSQSLNIYSKDTRGANKPATSVSWNHAARFVNWLNTSQGHQAAYNFTTDGVDDNIALWTSEEAWQLGGENLFRHKDAHYFLPSMGEWYKAAYYDPSTGNYFDYPTLDGSLPSQVTSGTTPHTAVYDHTWEQGPADVTQAGGLNAHGIMGMAGNVWEWEETTINLTNNDVSSDRGARGGAWFDFAENLPSSIRFPDFPDGPNNIIGFRVASVVSADEQNAIPEPGSLMVWSLLGLAGFHVSRRLKK